MEYTGKFLSKKFRINKLRYLVTGTGRCGTVYLAKLLTSIGIPCGHESVFTYYGLEWALKVLNGGQTEVSLISKLASVEEENKGIGWLHGDTLMAESSYLAAPFLDDNCLKDTTIIHVVRRPMQVINSFVEGLGYFNETCKEDKYKRPYHEFIYRYLPELIGLDPVSQAALYYVRWNEMIKAKSKNYFFCCLEQLPNKLFSFLDIKPNTFYNNHLSNHKIGIKDKYFSLSQIPDEHVRSLVAKAERRYYKELLA